MTENILDQIEPTQIEIFYRKSKKNLKLSFILVLVSLAFTMFSVKTGLFPEIIPAIGAILLLIAVTLSFVGIINGIKSYIKKEKHFADRFLILLGNLIISGIFVLMVIANILDFIRFMIE